MPPTTSGPLLLLLPRRRRGSVRGGDAPHVRPGQPEAFGGPEEPFKAWLASEVNYHGSRRDLNGAQVAWIIHKLAELPDHESETPNESR